jgi:fumarylacetoacetase
MFRPDHPLLPNYKHLPIAYHGRSSSIAVHGAPVRRPWGQLGEGIFAPTRELDYEVEVGAFIARGNRPGDCIPIDQANDHIAALCLLNDWSARDIQRWEYQPLGPFLGKNFATTISPWVVTAEALAPFRVVPASHETPVLPYLQSTGADAFDIRLEAWLRTPAMNRAERISRASFRDMYWTFPQMIAHHTSNGCPLRPGDLLGSGTVSGPARENRGCMLELTWRGKDPLILSSGESRIFLQDGDEVTLRGYCERPGFRRIGFGACCGRIDCAKTVS